MLATAAATTEKTYHAPAVEKALDVIELLGESSEGLNLTEIASALQRTKQELYRVLVCLQDRGYLVRDDAQSYRLSTKLFEIGARHASTQALVARALPHMQQLAGTIRESCHLSIVVQNRMLVIARVESDADLVLTVRVGASFELHQRTSGLVGLAHLPSSQRTRYWKQSGLPAERVGELEDLVSRIRAEGYAELDSPIAVGVTDCAAPVRTGQDQLLGVLCVSHIRRTQDEGRQAELVSAVMAAATRIAAEFSPTVDVER